MENINFLKFIELCFKTVIPECEYDDYQYIEANNIQHTAALDEVYVCERCMARVGTG